MSRPRSKDAAAAGLPPRVRTPLRCRALAVLAAFLFGAASASAQTATSDDVGGVVELFTSQGCSTCPPADETLTRLAADGRMLTLSYHVDYWDYIGWKDPLGQTRNADRQRAYAKAMGLRSVYTPQMVVNGRSDVASADGGDVERALRETPLDASSDARISLTKDGSTLRINAAAPSAAAQGEQTVLILVTYRDKTQTEVERGENNGRRLVNTHSVRDWQVIGKMNGKSVEVDMPVATLAEAEGEPGGCAAILQIMGDDGEPGAIIAAAMLPL